ncbi:MAG: PspC domain-containing protein, partial [Planctomycetes bacterium]|nr:PspC domain-containing protein [Planctomycetota bacterium]
MEKAISINLGGMLFNIDEDAYEQLAAYLKSVNDHYRPGGEEIIKDIEVSIAEKFSVKVKSGCQIMAKADVEEVIKIMGTVEEFEQAGAEETANGKNGINAASRKLYRNADDVVIAGVCSGLAVYFGVDPLIIRLIFIVLALANGLGILIYIIFWLIVSKAATSVEKLEMRGAPANLKKIEEAVKKKSTQARELGRDALRSFRQNRSALFYRIIALPVKIIEVGALFIKKLFGAVGPVLLIFFGLLFIVSGLTAIVGLSTIASLVIFQVDSPYIVSDLPLAELARLP